MENGVKREEWTGKGDMREGEKRGERRGRRGDESERGNLNLVTPFWREKEGRGVEKLGGGSN